MSNFPGKLPFSPIVVLFKMLYQNGGVSPSRVHVLLLYILRFLLLEPFRLVEILLYHKKIESHELSQPPLFILGYWRSGTSFLQSLVCQDSRMTSNNIYRSLFADTFYLTESWLKPMLNSFCKLFKIPYSIQRIPMDLNLSAEADMALCSLSSVKSYTWGQLFPTKFETWVDDLILFQDDYVAEEWIHHYDYFIRKLSYRSKGMRVVVKSPGDTGRVKQLMQKYPNAQFIYIQRDPYAVYQSNLYSWKVILKENSLQHMTKTDVANLIIHSYKKIMLNYQHQRKLIPDSQLIEINFEDLIKQPMKELSAIYSTLGLGSVPEKEIAALLKDYQSHTSGTYVVDPEVMERLSHEWSFAFKE